MKRKNWITNMNESQAKTWKLIFTILGIRFAFSLERDIYYLYHSILATRDLETGRFFAIFDPVLDYVGNNPDTYITGFFVFFLIYTILPLIILTVFTFCWFLLAQKCDNRYNSEEFCVKESD